MKINGVPGEFGFRALIPTVSCHTLDSDKAVVVSWRLTENYYFSAAEVQNSLGELVKWPVEVYEDGSVYVPSAEELE